METLPKEILLNEILLKLPGKDVFNACIVNKSFSKLCNDGLWFQLLQRDFLNDYHDFSESELNLSNKDLYKLLYGLQVVQKFINEIPYLEVKSLYRGLYLWKNLDLSDSQLKSIPKEIGLLQNLRILNLSNNQLTTLPHEVGNLRSLSSLYLFNNRLVELPDEVGRLQNLQYLDLSGNRLTTLPTEIFNLTNLQRLYLYQNRLKLIPKEISRPGLIIYQ